MDTSAIRIPESMRAEHGRIHAALVRATELPGPVGIAARELVAILHPHFVREEEIALPPLGLLAPLAQGEITPDMREVLPMTDALKAELPRMLEEHVAIRAATLRLETVARACHDISSERTTMRQIFHLPLRSLTCAIMLVAASTTPARAHCDTMDGPVVKAAQRAFVTGNVNYVLVWVRSQDEPAIRRAFQRALSVRTQSASARELADYWFFETLVRIHREGEGAPYTGIKPAGAEEHPGIAAADRSLAAGRVDEVERVLLHAVRDGLRERFQEALTRKNFDVNDVAMGRAYIQAYVPFLHYVEGIYDAAHASGEKHGAANAAAPPNPRR